MKDILRFQTINTADGECNVLISSNTNTVLFIEPEIAWFSPEAEGYSGIVAMHKRDFVRCDIYHFDVLTYGELEAIENVYSELENHSMAQVRSALLGDDDD